MVQCTGNFSLWSSWGFFVVVFFSLWHCRIHNMQKYILYCFLFIFFEFYLPYFLQILWRTKKTWIYSISGRFEHPQFLKVNLWFAATDSTGACFGNKILPLCIIITIIILNKVNFYYRQYRVNFYYRIKWLWRTGLDIHCLYLLSLVLVLSTLPIMRSGSGLLHVLYTSY